jgi:LysM repeat protein
MRVQTKSACVVLAWVILLVAVLAAGASGPFSRPRANTGIARVSEAVTLASPTGAATGATAARATARYVVQPGDTLSGIAARLDVRGGWPALYAANRAVIGPDPDVIDPGTVLAIPGRAALTRYTVAPGDTLSGIAAGLAVRGGWAALYAANRRVIGPDPDMIRPGTVLTVPGREAPSPAASHPTPPHRRPHQRPAPRPAPVSRRHHLRPARQTAPTAAGLPSWLKTTLLAACLVIGAAFLVEPVLVVSRRRRAARAPRPTVVVSGSGPGPEPGSRRSAQEGTAGVIVADYDRIVVTYDKRDDTACVLRPPGGDPSVIMKVARLALPEGHYIELAGRLGVPATWPIVLVDHHRVVVTCSEHDDTAYVLRPPGEDPRTVLRAARLVLPESAYAELADQLGVSASWPMEQG